MFTPFCWRMCGPETHTHLSDNMPDPTKRQGRSTNNRYAVIEQRILELRYVQFRQSLEYPHSRRANNSHLQSLKWKPCIGMVLCLFSFPCAAVSFFRVTRSCFLCQSLTSSRQPVLTCQKESRMGRSYPGIPPLGLITASSAS